MPLNRAAHEFRTLDSGPRAPVAAGYVHRQRVGRFGERLAARFLEERGARIIERNVRLGRGEIDLHAEIDGASVAVEVKTIVARGSESDALSQFSDVKADTVRHYATRLRPPAYRVDLVTVTIREFGAEIRWVPFVA